MFNVPVLLTANLSYGLQNYPLSGEWLDELERNLARQWNYEPGAMTNTVFILGTPQAGSDVLYRLLAQHCPELAYFAQGQLSVVDHYLLSDLWSETVGMLSNPWYPAPGIHEYLSMFNHPLVQGRYGLVATQDFLVGKEEVVLSRHRELSPFIQQLNNRLRNTAEGTPATFLNSYHVAKFKEAIHKSIFAWQRRQRPVQTFLGAIPASSLVPGLFSYLFPGAKFIHIAREPHSGLGAFIGGGRELPELPIPARGNTSDKILASFYGLVCRALQREVMDAQLESLVLHLTYEQLRADSETTLTRITNFLGIPHTPILTQAAHKVVTQLPSVPERTQRIEELLATYAPEAQNLWQRAGS